MRLMPFGEPIVVGENGHFLATDGEVIRTVVVTPEALAALTDDSVKSVSELEDLIDVLAKIADANMASQTQYSDNRIWVLAADVKEWRTFQSRRWSSRSPTPASRKPRTQETRGVALG